MIEKTESIEERRQGACTRSDRRGRQKHQEKREIEGMAHAGIGAAQHQRRRQIAFLMKKGWRPAMRVYRRGKQRDRNRARDHRKDSEAIPQDGFRRGQRWRKA
jgi:hypothetical protein